MARLSWQEQLRKQKEDAAQQKMEVEAACKDLFSTAVLGFNLCVWDWRITDAKYAKPYWSPGRFTFLIRSIFHISMLS